MSSGDSYLRIAVLERVADAARAVCRTPGSIKARWNLDAALDELELFDGEPDEPVTEVSELAPKPVAVRAAVAVAKGGRYCVYGSSEEREDNVLKGRVFARLCHVENCTVHFLEALVPVSPSVVTVRAEAGPDRSDRETEPAGPSD